MIVATATYRLQLTPGFSFQDAAATVPYLAALGVSHVYLSPVFEATTGSPHGYDVTDPTRLRQELGGHQGFRVLVDAVKTAGLRLLVDIVPNHMAASAENPWWRDVLEFGPASPFLDFFAIRRGASGRVSRLGLPVLGHELNDVLDRNELDLLLDAGLWFGYHEYRFPVAPATYADALGVDDPDLEPLPVSLIDVIRRGAANREGGLAARDVLVGTAADPDARRMLRHRLARRFGSDRDGTERLARLLDAQPYELRPWRSVEYDLPYRRFFDITQLVAVQVEDDRVFDATHAGIRRLLREAPIDGVRVDHVDGMRDPRAYLDRLAALVERRPPAPERRFVLVEKILGTGETLPADWPVDGTTGYDYMRMTGGWFIDPEGHARLREIWHEAVPSAPEFGELVVRKKRFVIERLFAGELAELADQLACLAPKGHPARNASAAGRAICEATAALDVYRTYVRNGAITETDRLRIEQAIALAAETATVEPDVLAHLRAVLLLGPSSVQPERRAAALEFILDWQQFSGPVMAKGFEDTALYNDHALLAANDVGGDPAAPAVSTDALHAYLSARAWSPYALNASSTHDTKRGEDVRARLAALSRYPAAWAALVEHWLASSSGRATRRLAVRDELLLLQTLVGTWPLDDRADHEYAERIRAYVIKAAREAKTGTSWRDPDSAYEAALEARVSSVLDRPDPRQLDPVLSLVARLAFPGALDSLSATCLKVAAPGLPDFYQGAEGWHFVLVDPDNRRPVDFAALAARAAALRRTAEQDLAALATALLGAWRDGRVKTFLTLRTLTARARNLAAFSGTYIPLAVRGDRADRVIAFARQAGEQIVIAVISRWLAGAAPDGTMPSAEFWAGSCLRLPDTAPTAWVDAISGTRLDAHAGCIDIAAALRTMPCALLEPLGPR